MKQANMPKLVRSMLWLLRAWLAVCLETKNTSQLAKTMLSRRMWDVCTLWLAQCWDAVAATTGAKAPIPTTTSVHTHRLILKYLRIMFRHVPNRFYTANLLTDYLWCANIFDKQVPLHYRLVFVGMIFAFANQTVIPLQQQNTVPHLEPRTRKSQANAGRLLLRTLLFAKIEKESRLPRAAVKQKKSLINLQSFSHRWFLTRGAQ